MIIEAVLRVLIGATMVIGSVAAIYVWADGMGARQFRWVSRARLFLNTLEMARARNLSPEKVLLRLADQGEREMGLRFHLLACWLREGLSLDQALAKVPCFLPRSILALATFGSVAGRLGDVLSVGQTELQELGENSSHGRQDIFGVIVLSIWMIMIYGIVFTFVLPKFQAIFVDMQAEPSWLMGVMLQHFNTWFVAHQCILAVLITTYLYVLGGPAARLWVECKRPVLADFVHGLFGFQRMRHSLRFGRMLARLLDRGMAEDKALIVAGQYASHRGFNRHVSRAVADLQNGRSLLQSLKRLKLNDDFHFRMAAAAQSGRSFSAALADWFDAMNARSNFRESALSTTIGTLFIIYAAFIIGALAVMFFQMEIKVMEAAAPW